MLRDLFPRDHERYESSRFGAELESFAGWLSAQGHLRWPLRLHLRRTKQALGRSRRFQSGERFDEAQLRRAFVVVKPDAYEYLCTGRIFIRFLAATDRLAPIESDDVLSVLKRRYQRYLVEVRGFSPSSLQHHDSTVTDFLARGLSASGNLGELTASQVENYIQIKSKTNTRPSLQHVIAHLRSFLRFCADHGEVPRGLDAIDTPRVYRGELPPRALEWTIVRRLLASIHRRSPRDWRDYAVLHLMAHYGLRPSEVAGLRVDSIDWEAKTLRVEQCKTRSEMVLPLDHRTLRLLHRYLQVARPDNPLPQLFLRARSPIRALRHYGVIEIFKFRVARSGLGLDDVSSYALRHSFAMRLLHRGVGIKAIGDLLGHRSLEATCVYLRLNTELLRTVALPVPSVDGGDYV